MQEINIKMGELEITTKPGVVLVAPSLGSCIGFAVYDQKSRMAAMAHIVLPDSTIASSGSTPQIGKYADVAVPAILEKMLSLGSKKENLIIKIAGGAQMFSLGGDSSNILNIGQRNIAAVKQALQKLGMPINKEHTGGNKGRTFKLNVINGMFSLKVIGQEEVEF